MNRLFAFTGLALIALAGCASVESAPSPTTEPPETTTTTNPQPNGNPGWADDFGNVLEDAEPVTATTTTAIAYANCDAVRTAGKAPIHRGDPGYSAKFDRDGDGVGCE